ncbi:adenylyltransferase/cytidyltransferase family protein [Patescibacteria group bacterium]|nr:adenylyltransferase/cytidyltransferase family protein [Patescibacteria group bacterium]
MTTVIYPGSFDPFTNGHNDILVKGREIFDELIIAIGKDPNKNYMFSVPERVRMIQDATQKGLDKILNVEVLPYK